MNVGYMFFKNIELYEKILKNGSLRKKGATDVKILKNWNFGFSKPDKEKLISSKKTFIDFKDSIHQKENIILYTSEVDWPICCSYAKTMLRNALEKDHVGVL